MSEIKALEELRVYLSERFLDIRVALKLVDNAKAEIAERFMELPVDLDGVPIHVGDCLQLGETRGEAVALRCGARHEALIWEWLDESGDWYYTAFSRHAKQRTLEDVLDAFGTKVLNSGHQWGLDAQDAITEYAAEIRELLGVS